MVRNVVSGVVAGAIAVVLAVTQLPAAAQSPLRDVVGGAEAAAGQFPWMVRLSMGCGGALIAPKVVLTAGHCVDGTGPDTSITVTAGAPDLKAKNVVEVHSLSVIRATGFRNETRGDDWAVIQLDRALDLPTLGLTPGKASDTGPFVIMGWGQTSENSAHQQRRLRYATVPLVPDNKCAVTYQKAGVDLVADEMICAGKAGVDTCQGDSGGPMVKRDSTGQWFQVGITSWGLGCARPGYPGVYTQVSKFRAAIRVAAHKLS